MAKELNLGWPWRPIYNVDRRKQSEFAPPILLDAARKWRDIFAVFSRLHDVKRPDVIIIGGGIVGLATAYQLSRKHPAKRLWVIEKEEAVAQHQTGHNSGVLHSGIYYKPGSLKAVNCRSGKKAMEAFCQQQGIRFRACGKVIVATRPDEFERLNALLQRGQTNGVACEMIDQQRLRELEPHSAGIRAIHVQETGIVDYRQVCERLATWLVQQDHTVRLNTQVIGLREAGNEVVVESNQGQFPAQYVVNCAGLHSDHIAALGSNRPDVKIIPCRGEYFLVNPDAEHLCRTLIYPVPDPRFPFLGVHFTRMISGHVECGPNAVLAFAREGYRKSDFNSRDLLEILTFPGFLRMSAKFWKTGLGEMWRSLSKSAFVHALQRLIPEIQPHQLSSAPAGVRAQAVTSTGQLLDDFAFSETPRIVNVLNAPSPAATASLSIGEFIADRLAQRF
jgi:(S)-2-hydroxyglutarate dehydrogenase